jgi:hypothetical protein
MVVIESNETWSQYSLSCSTNIVSLIANLISDTNKRSNKIKRPHALYSSSALRSLIFKSFAFAISKELVKYQRSMATMKVLCCKQFGLPNGKQ